MSLGTADWRDSSGLGGSVEVLKCEAQCMRMTQDDKWRLLNIYR